MIASFIDSEAFLVSSEELSIEIYDSEISKYNVAQSGGLSFRGIYNGNMGYSYTEKIDYDSIKKLSFISLNSCSVKSFLL